MRHQPEPTLEEILSEPIVRAVMAADGVEQHELTAMLRRVARMRREAAQHRPLAPHHTGL
jgi:hypothetical protein